jgi:hypothetical protein
MLYECINGRNIYHPPLFSSAEGFILVFIVATQVTGLTVALKTQTTVLLSQYSNHSAMITTKVFLVQKIILRTCRTGTPSQ